MLCNDGSWTQTQFSWGLHEALCIVMASLMVIITLLAQAPYSAIRVNILGGGAYSVSCSRFITSDNNTDSQKVVTSKAKHRWIFFFLCNFFQSQHEKFFFSTSISTSNNGLRAVVPSRRSLKLYNDDCKQQILLNKLPVHLTDCRTTTIRQTSSYIGNVFAKGEKYPRVTM